MNNNKRSVSSDVITRAYLDSLLLEMRHIDAVMPSTKLSLYGKEFSTPVTTGALSHLHNLERLSSRRERRYCAVEKAYHGG